MSQDRSGGGEAGAGNGLPAWARAAGWLFLVYGLAVTAAALLRAPEGWAAGAIRGLALVVIAVGLLRGARWAWILGVVFPGVWLLRGLVELGGVALALARGEAGPPASSVVLLAAAVLLLGVGWGALLTRPVRAVYLDRDGGLARP